MTSLWVKVCAERWGEHYSAPNAGIRRGTSGHTYTETREMQLSYTYGIMPPRADFEDRYEDVCPDGTFKVGNDPLYGNHTFMGSTELWDAVTEAVEKHDNEGDEESGDWASCVLSVLGFEWI